MKGSQVAAALAQLAHRRPEYDRPLLECLGKFVKGALLKAPTVEVLRTLPDTAGREFCLWLVQEMAASDLDKALRKIDPHAFRGLASLASKRDHLAALMLGRVTPADPPAKPPRKPAAMAAEDILKLVDRAQQKKELEKLSVAQLKAAVKKHGLHSGPLSAKPSKVELVEHILVALDTGWPRRTTVLEQSRYR